MSAEIRLAGPAYALGRPVPIEELVPAGELAARLRAHGFDRCSVAAEPPSALALRAVTRLFESVAVRPGEVDAVVHASCSYGAEPGAGSSVEATLRDRVLRPAGLGGLPAYPMWLAESGNLASVLRVARALVLRPGVRTVLCVTADRMPAGPGEYRAMPNAVTINGDGAAACLLTTRPAGDYRLDGLAQVAAPEMAAYVKGQGLAKHLKIMSGVRRAATRLAEETGVPSTGYRWLITNNYAERTTGEFADMAQVPRDRRLPAAPAHGHVFAADGLINLAALGPDRVRPGDRLLLLASGPLSWGAIGLTRTAPPTDRGASG
ncbi:3-oxoacyl-[acyl-carrier-protein] synthase 3 protein 3 [Actinoplanes sp. NBRC 14428]|nr:3-oxoacyl-[acyl-carrier-protein] synthase 3 protein 3 [Actinoplanes sp. NBRC 14428]